MFNTTEETMSKRGLAAVQAQRELQWRDRLARQVASRQSITAFCRSEGIAEGTFYGWRARLRARSLDLRQLRMARISFKVNGNFWPINLPLFQGIRLPLDLVLVFNSNSLVVITDRRSARGLVRQVGAASHQR